MVGRFLRMPEALAASAAPAMADNLAVTLARFVQRPSPPRPNLAAFDVTVLPPEARTAAQWVWSRRLVNECASVDVASELLVAAQDLGDLPQGTVAALQRLQADEQSHVDLAHAFLERLGHQPQKPPPSTPVTGPAWERWTRFVVTGLAICETVSAARFLHVLKHVDVPAARGCIRLFLKDELQHARLGFALLPDVLRRLERQLGGSARDFLRDEMCATFRHLDDVVGMNAQRRGVELVDRPQPSPNPAVVEPAADALAFYRVMEARILPGLDALGFPARAAWNARG